MGCILRTNHPVNNCSFECRHSDELVKKFPFFVLIFAFSLWQNFFIEMIFMKNVIATVHFANQESQFIHIKKKIAFIIVLKTILKIRNSRQSFFIFLSYKQKLFKKFEFLNKFKN